MAPRPASTADFGQHRASAYQQHRELAEQAHALAGEVRLRQAAKRLGMHRDTLKVASNQ
jgi:hypothetical protein